MDEGERIRAMTSKCSRDDCAIRNRGGSRTLLGWTPTYDKDGNRTNKDPNTTTTAYTCGSCGRVWGVKSREGQLDEIVEARAG